jgi:hypothetical protein
MKLTEQQALILERLIEAIETDIALPVRVGPRKFGNSMPDYLHTEKDFWILELEDLQTKSRYRTRQRRDERHRAAERRSKCSAHRISRMEQALDWVIKWVWDAEVRECLLAYATVKAQSWDWGRFLNNRNRQNPQKRAWVRQNSYRWICKSLQIIDQQISKSGFLLGEDGDLLVRQIRPEHTGKSITVDLHAWAQPDEIPAKCG